MSTPAQAATQQGQEPENDVNYWAHRYEENKIGWHVNDVNPLLIKFLSALTGTGEPNSKVGEGKSIFVPLCGKSKDMAYLHSLGFRVFGIEAVEQAILTLDEESGLGLQFNKAESTYHTSDNSLVIYYGDFFKCPIEKWGPFDCLWDRGSFIAMEYASRRPYIEVMKRSVRDSNGKYTGFRYLMETVYYDKTLFGGPPRSVDAKDMNEFYGDWTEYEALHTEVVPETNGVRKNVGSDVEATVYLLRPRAARQ